MYAPADDAEIERIFVKRLAGEAVTKEEELKFKTAYLQFMAEEYYNRDWVMQLHYGCKRDNNTPRYKQLGPIQDMIASTTMHQVLKRQIS